MATTESSLVPFDMALTSYSINPVQLNSLNPEQLFLEPGFYPEAVACFGDQFIGGSFELEDYSCLNCAPGLHGDFVLAADGLERLYSKRQRAVGSVQFPEFPLQPVEVPEVLPFRNECCCYSGGYACENGSGGIVEKRKSTARLSLSAQSLAARERRRKITEKTTELGRLIPGGRKMTTAEMLQAAHKYVRFLQAQVGLLQLVQQNDEAKEEFPRYQSVSNVRVLLGSLRIQEKLYAEEKCLATKELVRSIVKRDEIQSTEGMLRELEVVINSC